MIYLAEKITILFPPLYFMVSIYFKYMSGGALALELNRTFEDINIGELLNIILISTSTEIYNEFQIVSIINGMSIILLLHLPELGVIFMSVGIIIGMFGKYLVEMESRGDDVTSPRFLDFIKYCFGYTFGIVGFFWCFELVYNGEIIRVAKWIGYAVCFILGLVAYQLIGRLLPNVSELARVYGTDVKEVPLEDFPKGEPLIEEAD